MIRNMHLARIARPMAKRMMSLSSYNDNYVSVLLQDKLVKFENVFLRDACTSPESVDPFSRQKSFSTAEIVDGLTIKDTPQVVKNANGEDVLHITWNQHGNDHKSEYPESFLVKYSTKANRRADKFFGSEQIHWDNKALNKGLDELNSTYTDYMNPDSKEFNRVVDVLNKYGLAFIHDCPEPIHEDMTEENTKDWPVAHLAERFGYIKKTFYGTLFDVKNKKEAENIAYTKVFLPLHMDLLYYESPPGLQLLHALKNSTLGGENIFCDSYLAAQHIRDTDPNAFYALTQVPISYHYDNNGEYYYFERPLIVEEEGYLESKTYRPKIKEVNYAPPFQGPFETGISEILARGNNQEVGSGSNHASASHYLLKDFLRGYKMFEDFVNDPINNYQIKLPEGTTVIFDNRRVLHSRNEFSDENGGDRWLMGAYCDGDSFRSKLRIAKRQLK
ncbi:hypothetical protein DIURU_003118 [Diutina rugosa]|uniref:TauD/TfdA-like domain-containing protein n=1 Tax=Diutina rugosa TaxID=5481 RepID=A0A642UMJ9_DIURU|nr:uncharacterized protein DIURU_003118 [Diutina rugosa]KAA8901753.1 hypothetical protein DIURU_003118 [Diutina rugosa]